VDGTTLSLAVSMLLIGLAVVATAVVGLLLPPGHRLEALLALVAGAGAGIAVLAVEVATEFGFTVNGPTTAFLFATIGGAATVGACLAVILRRRNRVSGDG
jgi:hypothetical protein